MYLIDERPISPINGCLALGAPSHPFDFAFQHRRSGLQLRGILGPYSSIDIKVNPFFHEGVILQSTNELGPCRAFFRATSAGILSYQVGVLHRNYLVDVIGHFDRRRPLADDDTIGISATKFFHQRDRGIGLLVGVQQIDNPFARLTAWGFATPFFERTATASGAIVISPSLIGLQGQRDDMSGRCILALKWAGVPKRLNAICSIIRNFQSRMLGISADIACSLRESSLSLCLESGLDGPTKSKVTCQVSTTDVIVKYHVGRQALSNQWAIFIHGGATFQVASRRVKYDGIGVFLSNHVE